MLSNSLYQSIDDSLKLGVAQLENSMELEDNGADFEHDDQFDFGGQPLELMLLYDTEGRLVLAQGWGQNEDNPISDTLIAQALTGRSLYTTEVLKGREMRLYAAPFEDEPAINGVVVVGRSTAELTDASHELRTPLAVIEAESTLSLRKERKESDYRKSLELISREAVQMSVLVDKLLFLARADSGKEQLNLEAVNLRSLITDLASEIEVLCREKGLQFKVDPLENLTVKGDKVELKQLFFNLLDNAVRYTPAGGTVSVSVERQGDTAVIAIKDSGIGILEEHIPHIFERFYRVDKARSRAEGGVGLGLSICQHIAQTHGGRIEMESKVDEGSIFSVFLPFFKKN